MTDQFIPPWMGITTLAKHLDIHPNTVDNWVVKGILPPPVKRGGLLMWKWVDVDAWMTDPQAGTGSIADEVRKERAGGKFSRPRGELHDQH